MGKRNSSKGPPVFLMTSFKNGHSKSMRRTCIRGTVLDGCMEKMPIMNLGSMCFLSLALLGSFASTVIDCVCFFFSLLLAGCAGCE